MGQALMEREIEAVVREVTDEEVAFYQEYGWVMMKQLVDPEFVSELLTVGQGWLECHGEDKGGRRAVGLVLQEEAEPFRSFMFSERMSKNAMRLVNRKRLKGIDIPLRYRADVIREKPPGAARTHYHQDSSQHGSESRGRAPVLACAGGSDAGDERDAIRQSLASRRTAWLGRRRWPGRPARTISKSAVCAGAFSTVPLPAR